MTTYADRGDAGSPAETTSGSPRQNTLTPHTSARHFLGAELRTWRHARQLSVAELARRIFVSRELLQKIETAQRRASQELIRACDTELDTGGALGRLLDFIAHAEQAPASKPQPTLTTPPSLFIRVTVEVVPPSDSTGRPTTWPNTEGLATIYPLDDRRRQRTGMTLDPKPGTEGLIQLVTAGLACTNGSDREPLDEAD